MGKKSRLKRERRSEQPKILERILNDRCASEHDYGADFHNRGSQLYDLFSKYNAEDVAVSLDVSDLWLPNISSQVKHQFAFGVFAEMDIERFTPSKRLGTYDEFNEFIRAVHAILPSFPMLEDYIPEPDWGEVRVGCKGTFLRIFYGGSVERIPDFIEAFRLRNEGQLAALKDMNLVIEMQHRLINSINHEVIGSAKDIHSGHLEIPSEAFWLQCRKALLLECDVLSASVDDISPTLMLELGKFKRPASGSSFGDAVMTGTSLPAVIINVGGRRLPISLRNAASVVIDYWAERSEGDNFPAQRADISRPVASFLSQRLEGGSVISGPLQLASHNVRLPHRFAAVVRTEQKVYLVAVLDTKSLSILGKMERDVHKLLASGDEWALLIEGSSGAVQLRSKNGSQPGTADIAILLVLSSVATSFMSVPIPETTARVIWLPDFVTVFDSLENADELDKFWAYVDSNKPFMSFMSGGPADLFGSFRDSNALLVEGAIVPTIISLDPHWGSNWRYKVLTDFWATAPALFPDDTVAWKVEPKSDGLQRMISKVRPTLVWCTTIEGCVVHIMFSILDQKLDLLNGRLLELFVHCLADAFTQRQNLLEGQSLFHRSRIVLVCRACSSALATEIEDETTDQNTRKPLLSGWQLSSERDASSLLVTVEVNLARLQSRLDSPNDASFEVECLSDAIVGMSSLIGINLTSEFVQKLLETSSRKPRFTLKRFRRTVDVPDISTAEVPTPGQYKIARRDLAVVLMNLNVEPGRYELAQAKAIIDPARNGLRTQVHNQIAAFDRQALLLYCIEQHDALTSGYQREVLRVTQSLEHEVSYDRSEALAEAHERFIREARNYRYLLECCVSESTAGSVHVSAQEVVQLVASIDWLFVLYGASDVLHNDIDAAGVEIDHSFIPQVFYSEDRDKREKEFSLEMADVKLGIELRQEDEVTSVQEEGRDWGPLDQAFFEDLGFSLTHLTQVLLVLARWHSMGGEAQLRLSYQAPISKIIDILTDSIQGLPDDEAKSLVNFLILDPVKVRRLLGKAVDEIDVPVWDHNKREYRYTIRPLIAIDEEQLAWGAGAADRAARIWISSIFNGYLPAEFNWPHIKDAVRNVKVGIEKKLEVRSFEVCSRATPFVQHGIDFRRKFRKEGFEDVGDFDVLAYWPETNQWLSVECKYNKPPFCLKDARRLREEIFGSGLDRGQFVKIERRRRFLASQNARLHLLLGWPEPSAGTIPTIVEVYVSRDIYWWMRNPPFEVPTQFVRIDGLDYWLRSQGLLVDDPVEVLNP